VAEPTSSSSLGVFWERGATMFRNSRSTCQRHRPCPSRTKHQGDQPDRLPAVFRAVPRTSRNAWKTMGRKAPAAHRAVVVRLWSAGAPGLLAMSMLRRAFRPDGTTPGKLKWFGVKPSAAGKGGGRDASKISGARSRRARAFGRKPCFVGRAWLRPDLPGNFFPTCGRS